MDPITAVALACNVMQVAEYACEIISKGNELRHSVDGAIAPNRDSEACARELLLRNQALTDSLEKGNDGRPLASPDESLGLGLDDDAALMSLGRQCSDAARDLIEQLSALRQYHGVSRLRNLRQALEAAWSQEKVQMIEDRMNKYQEQMNSRVLSSISFHQKVIAAEQTKGFAVLQDNNKMVLNQLKRMERMLVPQLGDQTVPYAEPLSHFDVSPRPPQRSASLMVLGMESTIHDLVENDDRESVRALLDLDPKAIRAEDEHGRTALHIAAEKGSYSMIFLLLRRQANVNAEDDNSATPLHLAVQAGSASCTRLLVSKFADKDVMDNSYKTPAHYAKPGSEEAWILAYGADINAVDASKNTALVHFTHNGNVQVVKSLLKQVTIDLEAKGTNGPALFDAATKGNDDIVRLLLDAGADVNARGFRKATSLANAALVGNTSTVKLLLTTPNIELDAMNTAHTTALGDACSHSWEDVAIALIQAGANVEIVDYAGYGPIHSAAKNGAISIVKELLRRPGINVQWRGRDGWTALAEATRNGHVEIVELLLDHGADARIRGYNVLTTCLHIASEKGNAAIVKLLLEKGQADIEATCNEGYTPLTLATGRGPHLSVIEVLIAHGADANQAEVGKELWSPLMFIARAGGPTARQIMQVLVKKGKADVNYQPGRIGSTALLQAIRAKHADLVSELLSLGADANIADCNPNPRYDNVHHCPPICFAAQEAPEFLQVLVDVGYADVNARRQDSWTALHEVCSRGNVEAVEFLLSRGADRHIKAGETVGTALDVVLRNQPPNHPAIARLLGSHGSERSSPSPVLTPTGSQ